MENYGLIETTEYNILNNKIIEGRRNRKKRKKRKKKKKTT